MKRLLVVGLIGVLLCSGMAWAQCCGVHNRIVLLADDPNEPNTPPVELTFLGDPNDPNTPPVEFTALVASDPNDPNAPPVE